MSETPDWAMQEAIYGRLSAGINANYSARMGNVVDVKIVDNIESAEFLDSLPFVLIGDDDLVDESGSCGEGFVLTSILRCHAAGPARRASKFLAQSVREVMDINTEFVLDDWNVFNPRHTGTQSRLAGDGLGHLVTITYQFEIYQK